MVALGNDRILSSTAAPELNARLRALGFEVYDPDMSQFQLAGGGVHCMCQPLRRDAGLKKRGLTPFFQRVWLNLAS